MQKTVFVSSEYWPSWQGGSHDFPNAAPLLKVSWGSTAFLDLWPGLTVQQGLLCELMVQALGDKQPLCSLCQGTRLISVSMEAAE